MAKAEAPVSRPLPSEAPSGDPSFTFTHLPVDLAAHAELALEILRGSIEKPSAQDQYPRVLWSLDCRFSRRRALRRGPLCSCAPWAKLSKTSRGCEQVMKRSFTASISQEGDWYIAQCMQVDVASQGATEDEALENLRDALELHFTPPVATITPRVQTL